MQPIPVIAIQMTKDEAVAALRLLDLAVKAGGLGVSQAALAVASRINEGIQKAEEPPKDF